MADDCITKVAELIVGHWFENHAPGNAWFNRRALEFITKLIERAIRMTMKSTGYHCDTYIGPSDESAICARIMQALEAEKKA